MADAFVRACRWASRALGSTEERRSAGLHRRLRSLEAKEALARERARGARTEAECRAAEAEQRSLARARAKVRDAIDQPRFTAAARFAGLAVAFHEVTALATVTAIGAVAASVIVLLAVAVSARGFLLWAVPLPLALPLLAYAAVVGVPEARARRLRLLSLGRAPEAVNHIALALRLRPSLPVAVRFAAEGTEEPMAGMLRGLLWSVALREAPSLDVALSRFAESWRGANEDLRRALLDLGAAARQGGEEAVARFCDRARELVREGTKEQIRAYSGSLRAPAAALFALGVILPLTLGTVLPMSSLGSLDLVSPEAPGNARQLDPLAVILLLDGVFPAATFLLAHRILSRRPGMGNVPVAPAWSRRGMALTASAVVGAIASVSFLLPPPVGDIAFVLVPAAAVSAFLLVVGSEDAARAREVRRLEKEFPDALFRLGSLLGAGLPPETALGKASQEMGDSPSGRLFSAIDQSMRLRRQSFREILFGAGGLLVGHPSRLVRSSMRLVADLASRDSATASRGILETAGYLRDLARLETEMREALRSTVESVQATAVFFAPLVLGITCAMYAMLGTVFSSLSSLPLSPSTFNAASAAYLALSFVASTYFAVGVEGGADRVALSQAIGRGLPVAMAVFVGGLWLGAMILG